MTRTQPFSKAEPIDSARISQRTLDAAREVMRYHADVRMRADRPDEPVSAVLPKDIAPRA